MRDMTFGQKVADMFAAAVGSWTFIIIQSFLLSVWVTLNMCAIAYSWDPYPFILLNLFLSCQAAYTGPMVLMSQNRQASIDRETLRRDFELSEESARLLGEIVLAFKVFETDRKNQVQLLRKILCEMEEGDKEDVPDQTVAKPSPETTRGKHTGEPGVPETADEDPLRECRKENREKE